MKCAELDALMCDYVDGVLEEPARARVEAHLAECAACREMVADGQLARSDRAPSNARLSFSHVVMLPSDH